MLPGLRNFLLIMLFMPASCERYDWPEQISSFPMEVGTEWTYDRLLLIYTFESDSSDVIVDTDTIRSSIRHFVEKDTVLNDTAHVKVFVTEIDDNEITPRHYMYMDEAGLRCYAYRDPEGIIVMARKGAPRYIPDYTTPGILGSGMPVAGSGPIMVEDPPTLNLKFPLREGTAWTYRASDENNRWRIDKKVTGKGVVKIKGDEYHCFRVSFIYINSVFEGLQLTDWIAKEGLITREVLFPRAKLTTVDGTEENTVQIHEVIMLKDMHLDLSPG